MANELVAQDSLVFRDIEAMDLEALARTGRVVFTFVLVPLNIFGATGSPVRPLAVLTS